MTHPALAATTPTAPRRRMLPLEARAVLDMARMVGPLIKTQFRRHGVRDASPIVVLPGFGSDDRYTRPLRGYLNRLGYRAEGWGLGRNLAGIDIPHQLSDVSERWPLEAKADYRGEASVPLLCDRFIERLETRHEQLGRPITLIGWSLGGTIAREAARDLPEIVDRVITLGSPAIGGPKYTAAADFFRKRGMDLEWIERGIQERETRAIQQPITAIYSRTDAIVSWTAALDRSSPNVRHIAVGGSHLGMGFNPSIWKHIVSALESRESCSTRAAA